LLVYLAFVYVSRASFWSRVNNATHRRRLSIVLRLCYVRTVNERACYRRVRELVFSIQKKIETRPAFVAVINIERDRRRRARKTDSRRFFRHFDWARPSPMVGGSFDSGAPFSKNTIGRIGPVCTEYWYLGLSTYSYK